MADGAYFLDSETKCWVDYVAAKIADAVFHTRVAGVSHHNDDGSSRQQIIATCKPRDWLELEHDANNVFHARAIMVMTADRRQVGFLERERAHVVVDGAVAGRRYAAAVTSIGSSPGSSLLGVHIVLFRLSKAFVAAEATRKNKEVDAHR